MPTARRSAVLPLAVLGLLHDSPMHGYELRKRLSSVLGVFRALSYGSLYPCLRSLEAGGLIAADGVPTDARASTRTGNRGRIVYRITADGKERLQEMLSEAGPTAWEDEAFGVHFALFAQTDAATRLRILEGRRSRLEERLGGLRGALARTRERLDSYTLELQRHGLESVEREVRWLNEVIATERSATAEPTGTPADQPEHTTPSPEPSSPRHRKRSSA
jgi:DNA-binding PadR family transcriptional regulator